MLLVGDLGLGVVTEFAQRFPKQFLNIGVAEQNMAGVALPADFVILLIINNIINLIINSVNNRLRTFNEIAQICRYSKCYTCYCHHFLKELKMKKNNSTMTLKEAFDYYFKKEPQMLIWIIIICFLTVMTILVFDGKFPVNCGLTWNI
jgi:hypothetical protein